MGVRTSEEFADALDSAFSWRRTELHALKTTVEGLADSELDRPYSRMVLRSGVALIYAHWEGFAKQACQTYLDYIARRRLRYRELRPELVSTAVRPLLERSMRERADLLAFARDLMSIGEVRAKLPRTGVVDTGSNLRFERLAEILVALGLDSAPFATRQHLIDVRLCDARNAIAHGDFALPDRDGVLELHSIVIAMMGELRSQLNNAVVTQGYRAPSASTVDPSDPDVEVERR